MERGGGSRDEVGSVQFSPGLVRSVKRENAENQRARIAPELDRHGIVWPGCREWLVGIGCQRADGAFGHAERSVIDGGFCACHAATWLPLG